jgi:hypothetical protein
MQSSWLSWQQAGRTRRRRVHRGWLPWRSSTLDSKTLLSSCSVQSQGLPVVQPLMRLRQQGQLLLQQTTSQTHLHSRRKRLKQKQPTCCGCRCSSSMQRKQPRLKHSCSKRRRRKTKRKRRWWCNNRTQQQTQQAVSRLLHNRRWCWLLAPRLMPQQALQG